MVDFNKLRLRTPEQRAHDDEVKEIARQRQDAERRKALVKNTIQITTNCDAQLRHTATGLTVATIHGAQSDGKPVSGIYFIPESMDDDAENDLLDCLAKSRQLTLSGYWKKRTWADMDGRHREVWEFMAQFIAFADVSMRHRQIFEPNARRP